VKAKGIVTLAGASRAGLLRAAAIHLSGPERQAGRQERDDVSRKQFDVVYLEARYGP